MEGKNYEVCKGGGGVLFLFLEICKLGTKKLALKYAVYKIISCAQGGVSTSSSVKQQKKKSRSLFPIERSKFNVHNQMLLFRDS
jgi:hypothetical protein